MKLIIAGSRDFKDEMDAYYKLVDYLKSLNIEVTEIVSGGARGADAMGEYYATAHNIPLTVKPANWKKYGKSAGYIRNEKMAKYADAAVVLWNGTSKGSKHMINLAKKYNLYLKVIYV